MNPEPPGGAAPTAPRPPPGTQENARTMKVMRLEINPPSRPPWPPSCSPWRRSAWPRSRPLCPPRRAPPRSQTPAADPAATIKAARGQGVHFVSTATENGTTIVRGRRHRGHLGHTDDHREAGDRVTSCAGRPLGATGYVDANDAALGNVIGLTSAQSSRYAGRWMSFPASNTTLNALTGGLLNSRSGQRAAGSRGAPSVPYAEERRDCRTQNASELLSLPQI